MGRTLDIDQKIRPTNGEADSFKALLSGYGVSITRQPW